MPVPIGRKNTFHNEFIPLARVKGVIEAACQAGLEIFPWISAFISDFHSGIRKLAEMTRKEFAYQPAKARYINRRN
jgi:hypothetical protein